MPTLQYMDRMIQIGVCEGNPLGTFFHRIYHESSLLMTHSVELARRHYYLEADGPISDFYAVSDPDISFDSALDPTSKDLLRVYESYLEQHPDVECIGPLLRVDNIPDHMPMKHFALATECCWHLHGEYGANRLLPWRAPNGRIMTLVTSQIDTSFEVCRKETECTPLDYTGATTV